MQRFALHQIRELRCVLVGFAAMASSVPVYAGDEAVAVARAKIAEIGKQWNGEVNAATQSVYIELQRQAVLEGVELTADVSYGEHELQAFDLFVPAGESTAPRPVLVYLHGGGLVRGDKRGTGTDGLIYGNIGTFVARHGMIGINANYRLVPEVNWPAGAEDIRLLLEWVGDNIAEYGGDAEAIFLMGNSAGSTHVATYLFHEASQFEDGPRIAGALLSSGAFAAGDGQAALDYFGEDPALRHARSPLGLVDSYAGAAVPLFLWSAEYDPAFIEGPVAEMYSKLCDKYEDCPRYTQFQGHNHVSHVMSINSADVEVGGAVLDFIGTVLDSR